MGRKRTTGGVTAKGDDRIQFDFSYAGKRYRPSIEQVPSEVNLRAARKRLERIERHIRNGSFNFADEFPEYRFIEQVAPPTNAPTFREVAISYLKSSRSELAHATWESYRKVLGVRLDEIDEKAPPPDKRGRRLIGFWCPRIGDRPINELLYSNLTTALGDDPGCDRKTRNNRITPVRMVFNFAKADRLIHESPADSLKILKVQKPQPDPFQVDEVEAIIAGIREDWGDQDANYVEVGFFSGKRPSELIALEWPDIDFRRGTGKVSKARVMARDKDITKTAEEREVEYNPRAYAALERQYTLAGGRRAELRASDGERSEESREKTSARGGRVFPYHDLQTQWKRWRYTLERLGIRYREPYQMRHTSVTWNLMIGKNFLWVAEQHGHSPAVMLKTYAKWLKGTTATDIAAIRRAMGFGTSLALAETGSGVNELKTLTKVMAEREGFEPSTGAQDITKFRRKR